MAHRDAPGIPLSHAEIHEVSAVGGGYAAGIVEQSVAWFLVELQRCADTMMRGRQQVEKHSGKTGSYHG
jgi:hypothetical protein